MRLKGEPSDASLRSAASAAAVEAKTVQLGITAEWKEGWSTAAITSDDDIRMK